MERGKRNFTPIGKDKIICNINCFGHNSQRNSKGQEVCNVLAAPALDGHTVARFSIPDELRICILLNNIPSDSNSTR